MAALTHPGRLVRAGGRIAVPGWCCGTTVLPRMWLQYVRAGGETRGVSGRCGRSGLRGRPPSPRRPQSPPAVSSPIPLARPSRTPSRSESPCTWGRDHRSPGREETTGRRFHWGNEAQARSRRNNPDDFFDRAIIVDQSHVSFVKPEVEGRSTGLFGAGYGPPPRSGSRSAQSAEGIFGWCDSRRKGGLSGCSCV
jgi:hypothetical protein